MVGVQIAASIIFRESLHRDFCSKLVC